MAVYSCIGHNVKKIDSLDKVTGKAVFTSDISLPGMLCGKVKASPFPFARILSINTDKAEALHGVRAVITARNVPQYPYGLFLDDEIPLANTYVRYTGDIVAAVAAIDEDIAEEAIDLIEVEYEELTPVFSAEAAMKPGAPAVHPERKNVKRNIAHRIEYVRGEGEAAFERADVIVEERFSTQAVHTAYLENQACISQWDANGRLTLWASTQRVFNIRGLMAMALGIPEHRIRVIQQYIGGGFGGKTDIRPTFPISAFLAQKTGKPVKIVNTREEEFISGRPRISQIIDLKLGFQKDGTMVAKNAVITADSGAYVGCCPAILQSSTIRPDCLYRLPNIKMEANLIYTNTIPRGPFRGFGNPQMLFAMESLIDIAADKLGIDPAELRLKNSVQKGDTTAHGWILKSCGLSETIRLVTQKSGWHTKCHRKVQNRGFGIASQVHVAGNRTCAKEHGYDGSAAIINVDQFGRAKVISGESDLGQGMTTTFAQIAAETIGMAVEDIDVLPYVDSDIAPFCYGTFADRVTVIGGNAVMKAAKNTRKLILKYAAQKLGVAARDLEIKNSIIYLKKSPEQSLSLKELTNEVVYKKLFGAPITGRGEYCLPDYVVTLDDTGYGNLALSYTFATVVIEVEVDPETGKVEIPNLWYAVNVGKALNPKSCEGQIEGGVLQGIGYALTEGYMWDEHGRVLNPNFTDYKILTSPETPNIHCYLVEKPNPGSAYGVKGIGEPVLNPIAPAIANAIYNATGMRIKELPISLEKLQSLLKK